jgi:hypothetical protein
LQRADWKGFEDHVSILGRGESCTDKVVHEALAFWIAVDLTRLPVCEM